MLVDSHCHLDFPGLVEDLDGVIARAAAAGVGVMQTICTRLTKFPDVLALARAHDNLYCSVGVHPHNVESEPTATPEILIDHARANEVIGIGEMHWASALAGIPTRYVLLYEKVESRLGRQWRPIPRLEKG